MYYSTEELIKFLESDPPSSLLTDGSDYEDGKLESIEHTLDLTRSALHKLARVLIQKGVLTVEEAADLFERV